MEVRIVDAHDIEVPDGTAGEIVVRPRHPWVVNDGYDGNPEATVQAWRNGWFHTGDTARRDAEGNFFFVDRNKDVIRRRGENISSIEVERAVKEFAAVGDCAAVAVPSEHGDQEVLVVLSPAEGKTVDPAELLRFVLTRLPHFMVPRFIRIMDELPRTPSNKVRKAELRQDGLTGNVWDREKAGVVVRAPILGRVD
jgi:crotonobetaine/carnitine-CoA ligase